VVPHAEIGNTLVDYFLPKKPEVSTEGLEMECPECKTKYVYQQNELWYERNWCFKAASLHACRINRLWRWL